MSRFALIVFVSLLLAACTPPSEPPVPGVALELANHRAATLQDVSYNLSLSVPESRDSAIVGTMTIGFRRSGVDPLVIDFAPGTVSGVEVDHSAVPYTVVNQHIVVDLPEDANNVAVHFSAGDASLNRQDDFLYALFVPDRARMALPVFDQPNLKARWTLTLETPSHWAAVSNGAVRLAEESDGRTTHYFAETEPISTYLFTFVAGEFQVLTETRNGRDMTMYHRETDLGKVERNREAIFDLHDTSLGWLEDYSGIEYPFGKFDFVLIPSFQFGGMEHPGAIFYRASSLMLDENPPESRLLGRASLIAHETAHMWFGDLVTMRWFNDVWTKEVFANFMAAKIVQPSFPEIDHDLRFLLAHYPSAYRVDRTAGANAIRQDLSNLNEAGSLYGAVIYQKAPIVMRNLEQLVGEETFRGGMREYLNRFSLANATWPHLITILDDLSEEDLRGWSSAWVEEPGRPTITVVVENGVVRAKESDSWGRGRSWPQRHHFLVGGPGGTMEIGQGDRVPDYYAFILPNARGLGYGDFQLESHEYPRLLDAAGTLENAVDRGAAWITLRDAVLRGDLSPERYLEAASNALRSEPVQLVRQHISGQIRGTYWRLLSPERRLAWAPKLESLFDTLRAGTEVAGERNTWFQAWTDVVLTQEGVARAEVIWSDEAPPEGVSLSEWDYAELARDLAIRDVPGAAEILEVQLKRLQNPDQRTRFAATMRAAHPDPTVRAAYFTTLTNVENRAIESQVLESVRMLNHPLRARGAEAFIRPALGLVLEIQQTGDIFFPGRWLDAALGGHQTESAAAIVREFLDTMPESYPAKLKGKVLQSADGVFRAAAIVN